MLFTKPLEFQNGNVLKKVYKRKKKKSIWLEGQKPVIARRGNDYIVFLINNFIVSSIFIR